MEMELKSGIEETLPASVSYIAELQEFFRTRHVPFGSPEHLAPFVERLEADHSFRDEMSSMIRAIIYQARDGFGEGELQALIVRAVGGDEADQMHAPVRELLVFVHGVLRSRWNTIPEEITPEAKGEAAPAGEDGDQIVTPSLGGPENHTGAPVGRRVHSGASIFSKADVLSSTTGPENEDPKPAHQQEWSGLTLGESYESESGSRRWLWNAGFAGLIVMFCGGLFFAQRAAVDVFQQQHARGPIVSTNGQAPAGQIHQFAATSGPTSPVVPPSSAPAPSVPVAKPSPAVSKKPSRTEDGDIGAGSSEASLAQPGRYAPVALGVSPALMRNRLIYAPKADYPKLAKLTHVQGKVVVEAVVSRNGDVTHADVISGHRLLRGAALRAIRQRRYRPYTVDGKPREVATILTVDFRLR